MELDFEQPLVEIEKKINELTHRRKKRGQAKDVSAEVEALQQKAETLKRDIYSKLTPWQTVQVARHPNRPVFQDYVGGAFSEFIELHGDRCFGDDRALLGGFATVGQHKVLLLGMEKGKNVDQKVASNFGMSNPEGYRKALRLMKLAERFSIPVVCLVDTPAAYPGLDAEARGQAEAIARNLTEMATLETPILVVITGEGGSGGALGIAIGDRVLMFSHAIYSVIPPEGCAAILWRDASFAATAAEALKLTSSALLSLGIIDAIIPEPLGGAHRDPAATVASLQQALIQQLDALRKIPISTLVAQRYSKYTRMGRFENEKN